ncbi:preprotein translocase subunit SecG [Enterobacteriaceae endosymbiont of Donacia cincticornis]|uniref:preprotein translocase subunit SecG n=1 Tax=Enterobacteriaceae endosymbiont of Donacia cincticornis TaxID=2675773 RepID=UPI001449DA74|nr:preprotein translocase subunit SecG [Enterobacteriaceae endosymbiont of Donacia cincticornis]QJC36188.1 preprotein translocase subunit SecG [Enterobacteriaceae endosymbiont of Donacia cincticornis]
MYKLILILFIFVSTILISIILFQDNDEIDISASSNTKSIFNTDMSNKILTRSIILLASLFFIISLIINNFNVKKYKKNNITFYNINKI